MYLKSLGQLKEGKQNQQLCLKDLLQLLEALRDPWTLAHLQAQSGHLKVLLDP
jgi:hypothetical protein